MFKKLSNIGDCGIVCDFGDEVNQKINSTKILNFLKSVDFTKLNVSQNKKISFRMNIYNFSFINF